MSQIHHDNDPLILECLEQIAENLGSAARILEEAKSHLRDDGDRHPDDHHLRHEDFIYPEDYRGEI